MLMTGSMVRLPADVGDDYTVYVNGVPQEEYVDFQAYGRCLMFERVLRQDRISGWRWLLGASGVGTYRQDDTVDVRYEVDDEVRFAHALAITTTDDDTDEQ